MDLGCHKVVNSNKCIHMQSEMLEFNFRSQMKKKFQIPTENRLYTIN